MRVETVLAQTDLQPKREYVVEFTCASSFLIGFKAPEGLSRQEILQQAVETTNRFFENGGSLSMERSNSEGFYTFTVIGIDRSTGQILGNDLATEVPRLKLVD